jgi:hypothetical protein
MPDLTPTSKIRTTVREDGVKVSGFRAAHKSVVVREGPDAILRAEERTLRTKYVERQFPGGYKYDWGSGKLISWDFDD